MPTMFDAIKEKLGVLVMAMVVSIGMVFSDKITESIKTALNRSEQRPAQQEKLAKDFSAYIFAAENEIEYFHSGLTTKTALNEVATALNEVATAYNRAITTLRENEYVYFAIIHRYWGKKQVALYENFIASVRELDQQIHKFNPQILLVVEGNQVAVDPKIADSLSKEALESLSKLQISAKQLLLALSVN